MKFQDMTVSYLTAVQTALEELGFRPDQVRFLELERQEDLYRLVFRSDWMKYEAYVSAESGELLGLDQEPSVDAESPQGRYEFLYTKALLMGKTA